MKEKEGIRDLTLISERGEPLLLKLIFRVMLLVLNARSSKSNKIIATTLQEILHPPDGDIIE